MQKNLFQRQFINLIPILIIAVLCVFSYVLLQLNTFSFEQPILTKAHTPDYFADNFAITTLDKSGDAKYQLNAKKMIHYEDDQTSDLTLPAMRAFTPDKPPVTTTAKRGEVNAEGNIIDLYENAQVIRSAGAGDPLMQANSQHFRIFTDNEIIKTDKLVKLIRGLSVATANSMVYNNLNREIWLFGQVKSTIAPTEFNNTHSAQ